MMKQFVFTTVWEHEVNRESRPLEPKI